MGKLLFVTSEIYPYVKTGGLGDVSSSLPLALKERGADVRLFLPGYPNILAALGSRTEIKVFNEWFGATQARILLGRLDNGMTAYVLDIPQFYDRPSPYVDPATGKDWPDNHLRFAALCRAAADSGLYDKFWQPEIIHGNDWQCGLIPAYLAFRQGPRPSTTLTIHNLAFQGLFPASVFPQLDLPQESFSINGVEFHGYVGFLKAGLYYADKLTTVSPTYAREILTPELGCGLDGLLRTRANDLVGIVNGIDQDIWNPLTDPYLENRYDSNHLISKARNKDALLKSFGLALTDSPLFAVIGRLTQQKGFDLLLQIVPRLVREKAALIFMGQGDALLENQLSDLARRYPENVAVYIGYDEAIEHKLHGGADSVIMPSRFEPCGLVQLYSQRYGTVPIVRQTGGLNDTIINTSLKHFNAAGTGVMFEHALPNNLENALMRTMRLYRNRPIWQQVQKNAMAQDFSWDLAAGRYNDVYGTMRPG